MLADYRAGPEPSRIAYILLVEDEVLIRAMLAEEMRNQDLCVIEAVNADEAWEYLQAGGRADLVFSDIQMPGSMDGMQLAARVKTTYPNIKIIVTSGNPGLRNVAATGIFLAKPYQIKNAVETTLKTLNSN